MKSVLRKHHNKYAYTPQKNKIFYAIVENKYNKKEQVIDIETKDRFQAELYFKDYCNIHNMNIKYIGLYQN